ncbi:MAG: glycosyltransferase [Planctomycetaceae bacterium]|nr:glycosyltransferase [Planctomycetaceae bacterium]
MKVFMLGWEFPPHITGGLGTACYGLTKGLDAVGVEVVFVLPQSVPSSETSHVKLKTPADIPTASSATEPGGQHSYRVQELPNVQFHQVDAVLQPYARPGASAEQPNLLSDFDIKTLHEFFPKSAEAQVEAAQPHGPQDLPRGSFAAGPGAHYGGDLISQVHRYARLALELARTEQFDLIHAHDWMTYPAALAVAAATRKPLVVHVHSTEFDRAGENVNQQVYDIERMGMHAAAAVVCVSHLTENIAVSRYGVQREKCHVVYNAVEFPAEADSDENYRPITRNEKIVLFLGRLTMQKGPEYFLRAAKKVVERYKNVRFVMAGSGDMIAQCVREVAALKLGRYVAFTGFLRGADVARIFQLADLYVMPSVSEPFGIAPLEALSHNVPVIISRQSGVAEVLTHALKVDFWDTDEMANKILAVLKHAPLQRALRQHGHIELRKLSWKDSAQKLKDIYAGVMGAR